MRIRTAHTKLSFVVATAVVLSVDSVVECDTATGVSVGDDGALVVGVTVSEVVVDFLVSVEVSVVTVSVVFGVPVTVGVSVVADVGVSVGVNVAVGVLVVVSVGSVVELVSVELEELFSGVAVLFSVVGTVVSFDSVAFDPPLSAEEFDAPDSDTDRGAAARRVPSPSAHVNVISTKASKNEPPASSRP